MSKVYESIRGKRFHSIEEVRSFLESAGFEVRDITTQYCTVWEDKDHETLITLMFGGMINNFWVAYEI